MLQRLANQILMSKMILITARHRFSNCNKIIFQTTVVTIASFLFPVHYKIIDIH